MPEKNTFKNFKDIADGWSLILKTEVTREDVALCMAWVKMARLAKNPNHKDSWVDIAGYAGLGGEISSVVEREDKIKEFEESWQM